MADNPITKGVLLNEEQRVGKISLYARVTVAPYGVLAYHAHHGETETYYILSGQGVYNDNGENRPAAPGDVFFCQDGGSHGLTNTGSEPLAFMALIIRK